MTLNTYGSKVNGFVAIVNILGAVATEGSYQLLVVTVRNIKCGEPVRQIERAKRSVGTSGAMKSVRVTRSAFHRHPGYEQLTAVSPR